MIGHVRSGSAVDLLTSIRLGEASASEVVAEHLKALRQVQNETNAIAAFEDDRAMEDAARLDRAFAEHGAVGPLHGLPITVKDWIDVEGFPCAGESAEHRDRRPPADATVVARLRRAGAVVVAKTRPWGDVSTRSTQSGASAGRAAARRSWWRPVHRRWASAATRAGASACPPAGAVFSASSPPRAGCPPPGTSPGSGR